MSDLATKICQAIDQRSDDVNVEMRSRVQAVLDRELAALRADKARLDWLDRNPGKVLRSPGYRGAVSTWLYLDPESGAWLEAKNLTDAITRAMTPAKPE